MNDLMNIICFSILDEYDRLVKEQPNLGKSATLRHRLSDIEFKTPHRFQKFLQRRFFAG